MRDCNARWIGFLLLIAFCFSPVNVACGQTDSAQPRTTQEKKKNSKPKFRNHKKVPPKRIKELFAFVNEHHPEIKPLLMSVKKRRPRQFQAVMRNMDREVKNLSALKKKSKERYERVLAQWVTRSKTKLLAAQMTVQKSDKDALHIRKQIEALLKQYFDRRTDQVKSELANAKRRIQKLESQLDELENDRPSLVERHIQILIKNAKRISANRKKKSTNKGGADKADGSKKGNQPSTKKGQTPATIKNNGPSPAGRRARPNGSSRIPPDKSPNK